MKFSFVVYRRPEVQERIEDVFNNFLDRLGSADDFFGFCSVDEIKLKKSSPVEIFSLKKYLPKGMSGNISFTTRSDKFLYDQAVADDSIDIEFFGEKIDFEEFIPGCIKCADAFGAYRAQILPEGLAVLDYPVLNSYFLKSGQEGNGRWGIYRYGVFNYFDQTLVERALNTGVLQVQEKLMGAEYRTMVSQNKVAFWVEDIPGSIEGFLGVDSRLKELVGVGSRAWKG